MIRGNALSARRWFIVLGILFAVEVIVASLALSWGSSGMGGGRWLVDALFDSQAQLERTILLQARLPRVFFAAVVGASLASSGTVLQAVFRNPLAEPYVLGIAGGAALGATFLTSFAPQALSLGSLGPSVAAMIGACCTLALVFLVARWVPGGRHQSYAILLAGVVFNAFAAAAITFLKAIVSAEKAQELLFFLMGTLAIEGLSWTQLAIVAALSGSCLIVLLYFARDLNVISLGDDEASFLGVNVVRVRLVTVVASSVAIAVCVAFCGLIGFVGLVVPHALRLAFGPDHRLLLPASMFGGAAFLTLADFAARASFPVFQTTLPVGVVTAAIGAPLFLIFLRQTLRPTQTRG